MIKHLEVHIVEDDPVSQVFYLNAIESVSCHLAFSSTVSHSVGLLDVSTPDVFIVDLGLPDGDGVDAIRLIQKTYPDSAIKILVATASTDLSQHQAALDAGAIRVLIKPIVAQELRAELESIQRL